nr:unnamed protein product [Digitaria exilis]
MAGTFVNAHAPVIVTGGGVCIEQVIGARSNKEQLRVGTDAVECLLIDTRARRRPVAIMSTAGFPFPGTFHPIPITQTHWKAWKPEFLPSQASPVGVQKSLKERLRYKPDVALNTDSNTASPAFTVAMDNTTAGIKAGSDSIYFRIRSKLDNSPRIVRYQASAGAKAVSWSHTSATIINVRGVPLEKRGRRGTRTTRNESVFHSIPGTGYRGERERREAAAPEEEKRAVQGIRRQRGASSPGPARQP